MGLLQHTQYNPFDTDVASKRSLTQHIICFTGKERDGETGYGYFGARYMDHELMTMWLSVDRYASKYPSISPYAYCAWNPMSLTDPTGDTIKNFYEQYPNSVLYRRTQQLIDDFREAHPDEFEYLDNLCFEDYNGEKTPINIVIKISDEYGPLDNERRTNIGGKTTYAFNYMPVDRCDYNNNIVKSDFVIVGLINNQISITLFKHNHKISTLANEFGDAIFVVNRPETVDMQKSWKYGQKATTDYSFDYEHFITGDLKERPDPMNKEKYKDSLK